MSMTLTRLASSRIGAQKSGKGQEFGAEANLDAYIAVREWQPEDMKTCSHLRCIVIKLQ